MEIIQTTTITLTDDEKRAIHTIVSAYHSCVCKDCYECNECPLYVREQCVGQMCKYIEERKER